jgi:hypothetical protein
MRAFPLPRALHPLANLPGRQGAAECAAFSTFPRGKEELKAEVTKDWAMIPESGPSEIGVLLRVSER